MDFLKHSSLLLLLLIYFESVVSFDYVLYMCLLDNSTNNLYLIYEVIENLLVWVLLTFANHLYAKSYVCRTLQFSLLENQVSFPYQSM